MRVVFAGTPGSAVPTLQRIAEGPHELVAVVTRPDAPQGRKRVLTPSPVAAAADEHGLPVIKTARLDETATAAIAATRADVGVIVAYGGFVREPLLSTPVHGWVNLHFSALPRWRGAAPVQHALIAGDDTLGACVFSLVEAMDAGDVYARLEYTPPALATAGDVLDALAHRGAYLVDDVLNDLAAGTAVRTPQRGEATFAPKLTIEHARLDWNLAADAVLNRWRGVTPEPGAFTTVAGVRVKILSARPGAHAAALAPGRIAQSRSDVVIGTATEPIAVDVVQPSGKSAMAAADWFRGLRADDPVAGS